MSPKTSAAWRVPLIACWPGAALLKQPFSLHMAQEVLQDLRAVATRLSIPEIQRIVCDYYGVNWRNSWGVRARKVCAGSAIGVLFRRLYTEKTVSELGRLFQRSHASVVHALQTLERERKTNPRLAKEVQMLEEKTGPGPGQVGVEASIHSSH